MQGIETVAGGRYTMERSGKPQIPSTDVIFQTLSNRRRRQVVAYLQEGDGTATVSELAEHIAAEECDTTVDQLSSYERKRVYVSLYQNHLPKMDKWNVINYEENRKTVRLLGTVTKLEPYLPNSRDSADGWLSATVPCVLAAGVLLGALQVWVFSAAPPWVWTFLGAFGLVLLSISNIYRTSSELSFDYMMRWKSDIWRNSN